MEHRAQKADLVRHDQVAVVSQRQGEKGRLGCQAGHPESEHVLAAAGSPRREQEPADQDVGHGHPADE